MTPTNRPCTFSGNHSKWRMQDLHSLIATLLGKFLHMFQSKLDWFFRESIKWEVLIVLFKKKSADPSRRVVAIILCKIQTVPKIQNPKSEIQNPKSKIQNPKSKIQNPNGRVWGCHKKNGYYDNPKSKIQDPKSKIQDPRSKIQNPKSIQNPNGPFGFWILEFGFGWPGWGGYVANTLVWMGWPPKFGVVGRDSSLQAKGRRLDSPRARLKLGPDFQRVALLETEPRFPALRRGNWGPISRKIVESCGVPSNFSMRDTFLLGREIFRANIIGKVDWSLSMQLTFCSGPLKLKTSCFPRDSQLSYQALPRITPLAAMHGVRVGGWQALAC